MASNERAQIGGYTRYPSSSLFIYNGATVLHYFLGGYGIMLAYGFSWWAYLLGIGYIAFAFVQMYVLMPLTVCPNCVYYKLKDSLCISGLNVVAKRVAQEGNISNFSKRAEGLLCPNNMYLGAKAFPVLAILPGLILNFSIFLLALWGAVVALLLIRIFVIFPKIACGRCRAKNICPNAKSMGLREPSSGDGIR